MLWYPTEYRLIGFVVHLTGAFMQRPNPEKLGDLSAAADRQFAEKLAVIVPDPVNSAFGQPVLCRAVRSGALTPDDGKLHRSRQGEADIAAGVRREETAGEASADPLPELTARFNLSLVRGDAPDRTRGLTGNPLREHLRRVLNRGVASGAAV